MGDEMGTMVGCGKTLRVRLAELPVLCNYQMLSPKGWRHWDRWWKLTGMPIMQTPTPLPGVSVLIKHFAEQCLLRAELALLLAAEDGWFRAVAGNWERQLESLALARLGAEEGWVHGHRQLSVRPCQVFPLQGHV